MAQTFTRYVQQNVSTTPEYLPGSAVPASTQLVVSGLVVANLDAIPVKVSISLYDGTTETFIVKEKEIAVGASLTTIGWEQKLVLITGDRIKVVTELGTHHVDVTMSVMTIAP
jgi:hypothetical protein